MMFFLTTVLVLTASFGNVYCVPIFRNGKEIYPEENRGKESVFLTEGDIVVDLRRNAVRDLYKTWLNRTVPYVIDSSYNEKQRLEIRMAMEEFLHTTCVRFHPRTTEQDYIQIIPANSCSSSVGRKGGYQEVSIGTDCDNKGTIMHELMHALGFWHEHSRPDRDHYITIKWDNIAKEHEDNFRIYTTEEINTFGTPYDYDSIMHYRNNTFAIDINKLTIVSKFTLPPGVYMGQRERLSPIDIVKINRLYRCNITHCPDPGIPENGARIGDNFEISKTVEYHCDEGYTLVGSNARFCMDLGEWTGNRPVCLPSSAGGELRYCNFDKGNLCGWKQDLTEARNWTLNNRKTPSDSTGPKEDHTMGTPEGYYIFLESSNPCKEGEKARLISRPFSYPGPRPCMIMNYHMYGKTMGTLNVYQRIGGKNILKFTISGDHGPNWHMAFFGLDDASSFQLEIEAVAGSSFRSDMAVDDVVVGPCAALTPHANTASLETMSCDFNNNDLCDVWVQAKDDQFDWTLEKDDTSTLYTGPDCDPTDCANGTYLYTESSTPRQYGDTARISTPRLKGGQESCFSFSYHMYGPTMGTLNLYMEEVGFKPRLIWHRTGDHGNMWHREQVDLYTDTPFKLTFEGVRGTRWLSDMAIDNTEFINRKCADVVQFDCNFDQDWCGWTNEQGPTDTFDWIRFNHSTWTPGTGPSADHTTGSGYFVYIETSGPLTPGSKARLVSPRMTDAAPDSCLEFWYHMYGNDIQRLTVLHQPLEGAGNSVLWEETGDKGNWWRRERKALPNTAQNFQIIFEAVASGSQGDIAIDDVSIIPCNNNDAQNRRRHFPFWYPPGR